MQRNRCQSRRDGGARVREARRSTESHARAERQARCARVRSAPAEDAQAAIIIAGTTFDATSTSHVTAGERGGGVQALHGDTQLPRRSCRERRAEGGLGPTAHILSPSSAPLLGACSAPAQAAATLPRPRPRPTVPRPRPPVPSQ